MMETPDFNPLNSQKQYEHINPNSNMQRLKFEVISTRFLKPPRKIGKKLSKGFQPTIKIKLAGPCELEVPQEDRTMTLCNSIKSTNISKRTAHWTIRPTLYIPNNTQRNDALSNTNRN